MARSLNGQVQRVTLVITGLSALLWFAAPARSDHSPLPDSITTPNASYIVHFTNDDPYTPPLGAGDDRNYFPTSQAQNVADAFDNDGSFTTGNPNGYHPGYLDLGFSTPDFDGADRDILVFDCSAHGGCDSGNAPADRINLPTVNSQMYVTGTEPCLRLVMGHELFHHVQYAYITFGKWSAWGTMPVEGTARMMQDQIYDDLDGDAGCITYRGQVTNYMDNPNRSLWDLSYTSALFWKYASEQLGTINAEPTRGSDFVRTFWENAEANNDSPNVPATMRQTIHDFDASLSLEELFHRWTIANVARELDLSQVPEAIQYQYRDESDGVSGAYTDVDRTLDSQVPPNIGPSASSVVDWGARYYEVEVDADCFGIVGFRSEGDYAAYSLLTVGDGDEVRNVYKSRTSDFARAFIVNEDPQQRLRKLVAVVAGLGDPASFDYHFACGRAQLEIVRPDSLRLAWVGEPDAPERFIVRLVVRGPSELGDPTVLGLDPADFSVFVGGVAPENEALVLSGSNVQGEYWLVVQAPSKMSDGVYDLAVALGDITGDVEKNAVLYAKRILDQMLVVDRSGSMLSPAASPKLDAAKNAASLFVDAAGSDDLIGSVSFGGNNSEPDDDATLDALLLPASDSHRSDIKMGLAGISTTPSVLTSIGDGLETARLEFIVRGSAVGEDWIILLSDGMENEALRYSDVKASLLADGVKVHTIALGPYTDQALLQQIAADTGGTYYYVDVGTVAASSVRSRVAAIGPSAPLANRLADAYHAAFEAARNADRIWETEDAVEARRANVHTIAVGEKGLEDARFSFNWDDPNDAVEVRVEDPDGNVLRDGVGDVRIFSGKTHVEVHKANLDPGDWVVTVEGVAGTTDYVGILAGRVQLGVNLDLLLTASLDRDVVAQGGTFTWGVPMPILAVLTDVRGPIRGARVSAVVTHPDGQELALPLFDDGNHGDGNPNDGKYGNLYTRTTQASPTGQADGRGAVPINGSYGVVVEAEGVSNREERFSRIAKRAFQVFAIIDPSPDRDKDEMPDAYERLHECLQADKPDAEEDPDEDGLANEEEWKFGTDPCNADTDFGGESDRSELGRDANPFDPADDRLPRPEGPEVVDWMPDHQPPLPLRGEQNLIRYPSSPLYESIRLYAGASKTGPFRLIDEFTPDGRGLYPHDGLPNDVPVYYRMQGIGRSGETSAYSPVFSGTPKASPFASVGTIQIAGGAAYIASRDTTLSLGADDDDLRELQISNDPHFTGVGWQPFEPSLPWVVAPDRKGYAVVYARYRDAAANVSATYQDGVTVVGSGVLGRIKGFGDIEASEDDGGILVEVLGADVPPVLTDPSGAFALTNLMPGAYELRLSRAGFETIVPVELEPAEDFDAGIIPVPEPVRLLQALVALGTLGLARRRQAGRPRR